MKSLLWILAALLVWVVGGLGSARGSFRVGRWLLLGTLGFGLCCLFLGMLSLSPPPLGDAFWIRLLWSTLVLTVPAWVAFSYRFGRHEAQASSLEKFSVFLLWITAGAFLVAGLARTPFQAIRAEDSGGLLSVRPPIGRWIVVHTLTGVTLILWNLHATLEAARAAGRTRIARAIYAWVPLVVTSLYTLAELLLYNQQRAGNGDLLLAATAISTVTFATAMGHRRPEEMSLPADRPVVYSSVLLTALGAFFMALALLAEGMRRLGVPSDARWYQQAAVGGLVLVFTLWIFPGLRGEILRFLDRILAMPRPDYRTTWDRANRSLAGVRTPRELLEGLRALLRELFGPVRMQLWLRDPVTGSYGPAGEGSLPVLGLGHPLVGALHERKQPLVIMGEASTLEEIPLQVACEDLVHRQGLRLFFPIHANGELLGMIGCGPGGGRTLHPEDLELLQTLADHVGGLLPGLRRVPGAGASWAADPAAASDVEVASWLDGLARSARVSEPGPPVSVRVTGCAHARVHKERLEPMIVCLISGALQSSSREAGGDAREISIEADVSSAGQIEVRVSAGEALLSLSLPRTDANGTDPGIRGTPSHGARA